MDKKLVILGAKGMLGTALAAECEKQGIPTELLDLGEFDITDEGQLAAAVDRASCIVNCAAYTNVEKAETESGIAFKINAEAVGNLGRLAKSAGVWLLHISTDFVFDGEKPSPYTESDIANPINAYGRSKLAGEQVLIESGAEACIMRLEWTYGAGGNNFVKKIVDLTADRDELSVVDDQVGSPTATTEAAIAIVQLISKKPTGLFHFASSGYVSRFEMAKFIFEKLDIGVKLKPCSSSDFKTAAQRPMNSCFDCGKISSLLDDPIKPWQLPLEEFLRTL
jgi:dTDP-4-dehydrorhamnose reductase